MEKKQIEEEQNFTPQQAAIFNFTCLRQMVETLKEIVQILKKFEKEQDYNNNKKK